MNSTTAMPLGRLDPCLKNSGIMWYFFSKIYWSEQNFYNHYKTAEYMDTSHEFLHTIQLE